MILDAETKLLETATADELAKTKAYTDLQEEHTAAELIFEKNATQLRRIATMNSCVEAAALLEV